MSFDAILHILGVVFGLSLLYRTLASITKDEATLNIMFTSSVGLHGSILYYYYTV